MVNYFPTLFASLPSGKVNLELKVLSVKSIIYTLINIVMNCLYEIPSGFSATNIEIG